MNTESELKILRELDYLCTDPERASQKSFRIQISIIILAVLFSLLIYCGFRFGWTDPGSLIVYAGLTGSVFGLSVVYAFSIPQSKIVAKHLNSESIKKRISELGS